MSQQGSTKGEKGGVATKLILETLTNEMRKMFRKGMVELNEKVEKSLEQSRSAPQAQRSERLPKRGVWIEEEDYEGMGYEEEYERGFWTTIGDMEVDIEDIGIKKMIT